MSFSIGDHVLIPEQAVIVRELDEDGDYGVSLIGNPRVLFMDADSIEIDQDFYDSLDEDDDFDDEDDDGDWMDEEEDVYWTAKERAESKPEVDDIADLLRGGSRA